MADSEVPTLEVGFAIDFFDSFGQLKSLDDLIGSSAANAVREFQRVEAATKGAVNLSGATAQMTTFGNTASRELANVTRDTNRVEKAGEGMVRQIERQIEVFGKNGSEIRQMRAEMRALEAEERGLTELASRLRAVSNEMTRLERGTGAAGAGAKLALHQMLNLSYQVQDLGVQFAMAAQSSAPLKLGMMALLQQGSQIAGISQQAGVGIGAMAKQMLGAVGAFLLASPAILATAAAAGVAATAVGLITAEINKSSDVTVTWKDVVFGAWDAAKAYLEGALTQAFQYFGMSAEDVWNKIVEITKWAINRIIGITALAPRNLIALFSGLPSAIGDAFYSGVNIAIKALNWLLEKGIGAINSFAQTVNKILPDAFQIPTISASDVKIKEIENVYAGAGRTLGKALKDNIVDAFTGDFIGGAASVISPYAVARARSRENSANNSTDAIERQVALATATTKTAKAQAQLNAVKAQAAAIDKMAPGEKKDAALLKYKQDLTAAEIGLSKAREADAAARKAQTAADREARKDAREAARDAEQMANFLTESRMKAQGNVWKLAQEMEKRQQDWGKGDQTWGKTDIQKQNQAVKDAQAAAENMKDFMEAFIRSLDAVSERVDEVAANMRRAFGSVGGAIGDAITVLDEYGKRQKVIDRERDLINAQDTVDQKRLGELRKAEMVNQLSGMIALTGAAKNLFSEHSKGYKAMAAAEKALTVIQLARTAVDVAGGAARMFATLGPFAFPAVAAMLGVMAALGFSGGSSRNTLPKSNEGTGTVLGDVSAKSESIQRSLDALKDVDTVMLGYSRQMAASLKSIESQIGGFASLLVRAGNINASDGVNTGFKTDTTGNVLSGILTGGGILSKIPLVGGIFGAIGGLVKSLFGTKTSVIGSGLYGDAQSLEDILSGGFDASYYSDIKKKKKFFGLTTSKKYSTQYAEADPALENQFTLILRQFNDAIASAAGPLGVATDEVQKRLNNFVVNIGKIDLQGLTGEEIEEKLNAVFGAAADNMANAAFPGMTRFQKVGEGAFETLVSVASTVEAVTASLDQLGFAISGMSIDVKMSIADQFESVSAMNSAVDAYFESFFTKEEQAAAKTAQFAQVFESLGLTMPATMEAFRALVQAQDLTTAAGRETYAALLQLAPAFADLKTSLEGAKSAADILAERQDLQRRILELNGDTAALRALELAKLDVSNRALQQQIYAIEDAQEAAKAAEQLRDAWKSVGDTIMDEVKRLRGLTGGNEGGSFASIMGQFNAATAAARAGDQDAAGTLVGLSQSLIKAAELSATSRQELDRVQAQTAASLEQTYAAINAFANQSGADVTAQTLAAAAAAAQASSGTDAANDDLLSEVKAMREELAGLRSENKAGHAATASNTGAVKRHLDNVTQQAGGDAISTVKAA